MQTNQVRSPTELANFFLILTASNEIYDDCGELVSSEKIREAAVNRSNDVTPCDGKRDEELIQAYRDLPESRFYTTATLVKLTSSKVGFNPNSFFVTSCRSFKVDPENEEPISSTNKGHCCCTVS